MAIGKIIKGSHFDAAVRYLLGEGNELREKTSLPGSEDEWIAPGYEEGKRARILLSNMSGSNRKEWAKEFGDVENLRSGRKIKDPMRHITFSLRDGESLTTAKWQEVAENVLERTGYKDSPYLIVQHRDRNHEHIHIVTSRITYAGKTVSDSFEKDKLRTIAREIEEKHNLAKTPQRADKKTKSKGEAELVKRTGEPTLREEIQSQIDEIKKQQRGASEFTKKLREQGVFFKPNIQKSGKVIGVSFAKADKDGKVWAFKGSSLGKGYKWSELAKQIDYAPERDADAFVESKREAERAERGEIKKPDLLPAPPIEKNATSPVMEKSHASPASERLLSNVRENLKRQSLNVSPEAWKEFEKDVYQIYGNQRPSEAQVKAIMQLQAARRDLEQKPPETVSRLDAADYLMQHGSERQRDGMTRATLERYEEQARDEGLRKQQMEKESHERPISR